MPTSLEHRQAALDAIAAVVAGAVADTAETETVDFKEETGTVSAGGVRGPIDPHHEQAAQALATEVACMANSERGGVLVVGVNDAGSGPAALVGTYLDTQWLRERIYALTQPSVTVEIEEILPQGVRLYLVYVVDALEEVRVGGKLRTRVGRACVELTGDRARQFLESRRAYDWTAEPSAKYFADADPRALASARDKYRAARGLAPESDLELCRRLGLLADDGPDFELNRAGAVLLTGYEPAVEQLVVLHAPAEGLASTGSVRGPAPLLTLFDAAWDLITQKAFPDSAVVVGHTRRLLRAIPDLALREALVNAIMHRDYRLAQQAIVVHATRDTLKVTSPGGFVSGVNPDRLIATSSITRNPKLSQAMRGMGLGEREGVGVDTMYAEMLRAGHDAPVIVEDTGSVVVTLHGGAPDVQLVEFFEQLRRRDVGLDNVRTAVALRLLLAATPLRAETLATEAQCTLQEATVALARLEEAGVVTRLVNRSLAFRVSEQTAAVFAGRLRYPTRRKLDEHWELVRAFLDSAPQIGREDAAELLGVAPNSASRILSDLAREGWLRPAANARGPRVRYIAA